jgi:hypothetical protein
MPVPHEGANLQCFQNLGEARDPESGVSYPVVCRKRAGHPTPKGEEPHVPVDTRFVAAPTRVAHGFRFAPGGIPAGVDQTITIPHDCANHLKDVEDIANGIR